MISRLYYVCCDVCGNPCGGSDDCQITGKDARRFAVRAGWKRRAGTHGPRRDVCPDCDRKEAEAGDD